MEDLIKGELDWHNKVNENFHEVDSQMADIAINVLHPPVPLIPPKGDGITDDSTAIQNIINFAQNNGYSTVFVPSKKYLCDHNIVIDISKISFIGDFSLFDFSNMTMGHGFTLTAPNITYNTRYKLKRTFKGIIINPDLNPNSRINIDGIYLDNDKELDNFRIENCCVMCCNNNLLIRHAWRVSIDNCLSLWSNHHINTTEDLFDSGENFHFTSCMFADGGDMLGKMEMMFDNCSFDNVPILINRDTLYFSHCHFERVGEGTYQTTPFIDIQDYDAGANCSHCSFNTNQFKFQCGLFNVADNCKWKGLKLDHCTIALNTSVLDIASFISNGELPILITGKGRVEITGISSWENSSSAIAVSKSLNMVSNGDAESNINPFTITASSTGTIAVSADDKFTGTQSYRIHCNSGQNLFANATLNVKPGQLITGAFIYKVNNSGSTTGKLAWMLSFKDDAGNSISPSTGKPNYLTAGDTAGTWHCSVLAPFDIVPPSATKAIFQLQGLNGSGESDLDIYIDEIVLNVL